ncbi:hypothetical protein G7Y89_g11484 [Cudoniella acicularis]|uniref:S-adenosyl-L-methionine-dependent methyltransferase n=1 Tax=Cudoniella acicularis TaxID=354080 RepID=A0A8H4RD15_9HELO|nr:hypothetical protein G7Y89_g11484 [Cudoniella acicularis]
MSSPPREVLAVDNGSVESVEVNKVPVVTGKAEEPAKLSVDQDQIEDEQEVIISATASVSSSLYESIEENGRTYHKYKEGKYFLPNDELEQNRLDLQHHLCKLTLHGRLHLAPLKNTDLKHALDFGTGTGIWAIEFGNSVSSFQTKSNSTNKIPKPSDTPNANIPANLSFEVDDIEDAWVYPHPFTYIHGRLMAFALRNPQTIFRKAFDALSPGGYFEMQDLVPPSRSIDNTFEGTALQRCAMLMIEAGLKVGMDITAPARYKSMMEEVGFVDVKEVMFEWPIGTWAKSQYHKRIGAWFMRDIEIGLEGIMMGLLTRVLGMSREEVGILSRDTLKEMRDPKIHCYQPFSVIYGRKPE